MQDYKNTLHWKLDLSGVFKIFKGFDELVLVGIGKM